VTPLASAVEKVNEVAPEATVSVFPPLSSRVSPEAVRPETLPPMV
jgi:hypothetical protein